MKLDQCTTTGHSTQLALAYINARKYWDDVIPIGRGQVVCAIYVYQTLSFLLPLIKKEGKGSAAPDYFAVGYFPQWLVGEGLFV